MRRGSRKSECFLASCPECNGNLYFEKPFRLTLRCEKCNEIQQIIRCSADVCEFYRRICTTCYSKSEQSGLIVKENFCASPEINVKRYKWVYAGGITLILLIILPFYYINSLEMDKNVNVNSVNSLFKKLRKIYPSQRRETWYHFLSVLENKPPSVKSITFLHGEDKTTSDCLVNELISQFSGNKNIMIEEITFSEVGFEGVDYGIVLQHYRAVVKKFRVFRADLTEVSGEFARIFHSLCDEVSSDIKPSLFIFTVKCSRRTENLNPLERATTVLRETWNDLPSNELFPLLSRVIKNVVEIIPETQSSCLTEH